MEQVELFSKETSRPGDVEAWCKTQGLDLVLGVDEAGRGPLAGPVFAAAVILDMERLDEEWIASLNDSKKLGESSRVLSFDAIVEGALSYGIASVDSQDIDKLNILQATFEAMRLAIEQACDGLEEQPRLVMVDGRLTIPRLERNQRAFVGGDGRSLHIAAASILAKVSRDRLMVEYDQRWPEYGFATNKGYATLFHREAIKTHGPCPIHRLSFARVKEHAGRLRG
ncbi:MAG: ribonuclease HII [Bradymonadaceae bacterium]